MAFLSALCDLCGKKNCGGKWRSLSQYDAVNGLYIDHSNGRGMIKRMVIDFLDLNCKMRRRAS